MKTQAANNLDKMLTKGSIAKADVNNKTHQEAISCAYCHRIKAIKKGKRTNTNIINKQEKAYYTSLKNKINPSYHKLIEDKNQFMKSGNSCIGCHSHKMNKHSLNVCSTEINNKNGADNCVSCHMPKIDGHAFHGFAGSHFNSEMLTKYVDISVSKNAHNFSVNINNKSSHSLLLHPLRVAVLKMSITRAKKTIKIKKEVFVRIIGKDNKPAMPWIADAVLKNTMIQANEKRSVKRNFTLQKGDKLNVVLGWFLVNPKALKKLGLQNEEVATKFNVFKKQSFEF